MCRKVATTSAAVAALFRSINPGQSGGEQLTGQVARAVHAVAAVPDKGPAIWRSIYTNLKDMIQRLNGQGSDFTSNQGLMDDLRSLVVEPSLEIEALRELREELVTTMTTHLLGVVEAIQNRGG